MGAGHADNWRKNILGRARRKSKALSERELACSRHYAEARTAGKWEEATSEKQCGAGGKGMGGSGRCKTSWVMLKTLDFILSWIDVESFKWQRFQK